MTFAVEPEGKVAERYVCQHACVQHHADAQVHLRPLILARVHLQAALLHSPAVAQVSLKLNLRPRARCTVPVMPRSPTPSHSRQARKLPSLSQAVGLLCQRQRKRPLGAATELAAFLRTYLVQLVHAIAFQGCSKG